MIKSSLFFVFLGFLFFQSCQKRDENGNIIIYEELYKSHWLLGEWEKKDSLGILKEIWTSKDDSTYAGKSYYIQGKDTIHKESIDLMEDKEQLFYSTTIIGENHNQSVTYKMTKDTDSLLVFENPTHGYPNKIQYKLLKNKTIIAIISGKEMGKSSVESYPMDKIK